MHLRRLTGFALHLAQVRMSKVAANYTQRLLRQYQSNSYKDVPVSCATDGISNAPLKRTDHTFSRGQVLEGAETTDDHGWVEVSWGEGLKTHYPYVWLRDNCTCDKCFSPATLSRLFLLRNLDVDIKPKCVKVDSSAQIMQVDWPDGHISNYPAAWLEGRSFTEQTKTDRKHWLPVPMELWSNQLQDNIPSFEFEKLLKDDQTLFDWITGIQRFGLVLLKGAPGKPGQLHRIAERVAFLRKTNYGETFQVKSKADPSNLAYTPGTLGLHTDLNFYTYTPGIQMLHCVEQAPTKGGDNVLCDGFNAAYILKERHRDLFDILTTTIVDHLNVGNDYIRFFQLSPHPIIRVDGEGRVQKISLSNASRDSYLSLPLETIKPLYKAIIAFVDIMYEPENHITYKLKQGDIICIHNHRVLHGRNAYTVLSKGNRHLEGGYIDWDELNSMRRVLIMDLDLHKNM